MSRWKSLIKLLKAAWQEAFPKYPCRIVGCSIDNLTKRAQFTVKARRIPMPIQLTTKQIIACDKYFHMLPAKDRQRIERQYLIELNRPIAFIEEFPLTANLHGEYIFKVLLLENKKIICGTAEYFIKQNKQILQLLSREDVMKLTKAYCTEKYVDCEAEYSLNQKLNSKIHYL
ncbi:MAG: hypothetical protein P1U40_07565 [Coxiellaceae bacterium]|nr:hypothetical protein [Coxiellaceae bacterium]